MLLARLQIGGHVQHRDVEDGHVGAKRVAPLVPELQERRLDLDVIGRVALRQQELHEVDAPALLGERESVRRKLRLLQQTPDGTGEYTTPDRLGAPSRLLGRDVPARIPRHDAGNRRILLIVGSSLWRRERLVGAPRDADLQDRLVLHAPLSADRGHLLRQRRPQ